MATDFPIRSQLKKNHYILQYIIMLKKAWIETIYVLLQNNLTL